MTKHMDTSSHIHGCLKTRRNVNMLTWIIPITGIHGPLAKALDEGVALGFKVSELKTNPLLALRHFFDDREWKYFLKYVSTISFCPSRECINLFCDLGDPYFQCQNQYQDARDNKH